VELKALVFNTLFHWATASYSSFLNFQVSLDLFSDSRSFILHVFLGCAFAHYLINFVNT